MAIEKQWCLFSAGAALVLGLSASAVGCRASPQTGPGGAGGDGTGGEGATTVASSSSGTAGAGGTGGAGGAGGGGGSGGGEACSGSEVTIEQITNEKAAGAVGKGSPVSVKGAVVMSQKFLVSKSSSSGTCLYGVFVSAPGLTETAPYSGIMVVSKGNNAVIPPGQQTSYCGKISNRFADDPLPGDSIPDDIKPGDVVDVIGVADYFLLNACANEMNGSQVAQRQIAFACKVEKTGTATPPTPHAFTTADEIAKLASSTDKDFHDQWGGVKVRVGDVSPLPQPDPGGGSGDVVVGDFGIIKLSGSNLEVGDKLYYRGYDPQTCYKGPMFSDINIKWTAIDGFGYLNYCTWGLQPNNKCVDFNPASEDCSGVVCQ